MAIGLGLNLMASVSSFAMAISGFISPILNLNFTTGTLDSRITFSRPSNATLYDSTGKLTYAPNNLLLRSQEFDNASWVKVGATVTANTSTAPDGTLTADLVYPTTTGTDRFVYQLAEGGHIMSVYAKAAGKNWIYFASTSTTGFGAWFDLLNGVVGTVGGSVGGVPIITSVGNGWFRCSLRKIQGYFEVFPCDANGSTAVTTNGTDGVLLWGAQLEAVTYQTTPRPYVATTSAAYYGPRFDYDPVTLQPKGLLIEEARTNLLTYSEQFNNAAWTKSSGVSVTPNTNVAPDGTTAADTVTSGANQIDQTITVSQNTVYTNSLYFKKTSGATYQPGLYLLFSGGTLVIYAVRLNTDSGVATAVSASGFTAPASFSVMEVGGYWRLSITGSSNNNTSGLFRLYPNLAANGASGAGSQIIWGAQLETGSFATSYIPTAASSVARSADTASMTGSNFSSWYRQDEGTLLVNYTPGGSVQSTSYSVVASDGTGNEVIGFRNRIATSEGIVIDGGPDQAAPVLGSAAVDLSTKLSLAYRVNDFAGSSNGGTVVTDTAGTLPTPTTLYFGSFAGSTSGQRWVATISYYNRRLPNAQLQSLTA